MAVPKSHILVADDERNIRQNLAMVLEAGGHSVDQAKDGDEALDLCKQNHPDIAFVDLHMPKVEGLKVLAHIRALSPKTAVVIITAYGSAANAVEAMKLGAIDFLEKPFDPQIIGILTEEILIRQHTDVQKSYDDLMRLAELARLRNAPIETRTYLKSAMVQAADRPEPYYWLGNLCEAEGDQKRAVQYYYMAVSAYHTYEPAVDALKRLGKLH